MIKWSEFVEKGVVFEAFLPEHEKQRHAWLLRASCNGHVLEERCVRLVWPPRFGPDAGDVAAVEAELDAALSRLAGHVAPVSTGSYMSEPSQIVEPSPRGCAILHQLLAEYVEAESSLHFTPERTARFLDLPVGQRAEGLFPMAITPRRDGRMRKLIALAGIAGNHPSVAERVPEIEDAIIRDDVAAIGLILRELGIDADREPEAF